MEDHRTHYISLDFVIFLHHNTTQPWGSPSHGCSNVWWGSTTFVFTALTLVEWSAAYSSSFWSTGQCLRSPTCVMKGCVCRGGRSGGPHCTTQHSSSQRDGFSLARSMASSGLGLLMCMGEDPVSPHNENVDKSCCIALDFVFIDGIILTSLPLGLRFHAQLSLFPLGTFSHHGTWRPFLC